MVLLDIKLKDIMASNDIFEENNYVSKYASFKFTEAYKKRCVKKLLKSGKGCERFSMDHLNRSPVPTTLLYWVMQYAPEDEIPESYKVQMVRRYMNVKDVNSFVNNVVPKDRIYRWYKQYKNGEIKIRSIGTDNYKNKRFIGSYREDFRRDFVNEFINQDSLLLNHFEKSRGVGIGSSYAWFKKIHNFYEPTERYSTQSRLKLVSMHLDQSISLHLIHKIKYVPISFLKQFLQEYKEGKLNNNHGKEEQMNINTNIDKSTRTLNLQLDQDSFKLLQALSFVEDKSVDQYISDILHKNFKDYVKEDLTHIIDKLV